MLIEEDNFAAIVTAILAASAVRNAGMTDPVEIAATFQKIGAALQEGGALPDSVGKRLVSGHRAENTWQ